MLARVLRASMPMLVSLGIMVVVGGLAAWRIAKLTDGELPRTPPAVEQASRAAVPARTADENEKRPRSEAPTASRPAPAPQSARPLPRPRSVASQRVSGSNPAVILSRTTEPPVRRTAWKP